MNDKTINYVPDPGNAPERLRLHNRWRRGEIDLDPNGWHTPTQIGEIIDAVLDDLAAVKIRNARLQSEPDGTCNAEELRQVRAENARLRAELDALAHVACPGSGFGKSAVIMQWKRDIEAGRPGKLATL